MWKWKRRLVVLVSVMILIGTLLIMFIERAGEVAHAEAVEKPLREMNQGDAIIFAGQVWIGARAECGFYFET